MDCTCYVCTSPRPLDASACTETLINLVVKLRELLPGSQTLISADGRAENVSDERWAAYQSKLRSVEGIGATVVRHQTWKHQANALRDVMQRCNTEFVFVCQDDLQLHIDALDIQNIRTGFQYAEVEHVRIHWYHRLRRFWRADKPGTPHPCAPFLKLTYFWSDRPHFARLSHYQRHVWPQIPRTAKRTMEQVISKVHRGPMCWIYLHRNRKGESHDACGTQPSFNIRDPVPYVQFWHWCALLACVAVAFCLLRRIARVAA